ncbi:MAG: thioredoxin fold domain-containing protein [Flavipsychrobacter sp.]
MNINKLFVFLLCCLPALSFAQQKDCKALLKEKIEAGQPKVVSEKIRQLAGCGLDSVDVMMVDNNTLISTFLVKEAQEDNNGKPTYGDFVKYVETLKTVPDYQKSKQQATTLLALKNKTASLQTWDEDTKIFSQVGYSPRDLAAVKQLLKENIDKGWTYQEVFSKYGEAINARKRAIADSTMRAALNMQLNVLEEERKRLAPYCDTNDLVVNNFYLPSFTNYDKAVACAKKSKRPLLIYFNGKNCANCRSMESTVFSYDMVRGELRNYILADISCDETTPLPANEQQYSKALKKELRTTGDKNQAIEMEQYGTDTKPYFIIVDVKGKVLDRRGFTPDWMEYYNFLKEGISKFLKAGN